MGIEELVRTSLATESSLPPGDALLHGLLAREFGSGESSTKEGTNARETEDGSVSITPEAGFVVKLRTLLPSDSLPAKAKVFLNISHSPRVPAPPPASPAQIRDAISRGDPDAYRVPLSLSEVRSDVDKAGRACVVVDACVHSDVVSHALQDEDFRTFVVTLALEWAAEKHSLSLDYDAISFPKLRAKGSLQTHVIRRPQRPAISEVASSSKIPSLPTPEYTLEAPPHPAPPALLYTVSLPACSSLSSAILEFTKNSLHLSIPDKYTLNLVTPAIVDTLSGSAVFDIKNRSLCISLACL